MKIAKRENKKISLLKDLIYEKVSMMYGVVGFFSDNKFTSFLFSFLNKGFLEIKTFPGNYVFIACHIVISYNVYVGSVGYDAYRTIVGCATRLGFKIKKVEVLIDMVQ